jgi:prolyl oligopeptidase
VSYEDPYQWLEADSDEVAAWEAAQNAFASEFVTAWPRFDDLRKQIASCAADTGVSAPVRAGAHWFRVRVPAGADKPLIEVSDEPCGEARVLVDLNERGDDSAAALDWFTPSPRGRYVAYGVSEGGDARSTIHLLDVASGKPLPDRVPHELFQCAGVAWLPDESGFYYRAVDPATGVNTDSLLFVHRIGERPPAKPEPVAVPAASIPVVSVDGDLLLVQGRVEFQPLLVKDLAGDGPWEPFFAEELEGVFDGVLAGDAYVAVTTDAAPNGRVVAIPIATRSDRSTWRELLPASETVVRSVELVGDRLLVHELRDTYAHVRVLGLNGTAHGDVPLPGRGTVARGFGPATIAGDPEGRDFVFVYSSFAESASIHRYRIDTGEAERLVAPELELDGVLTRLAHCTSADGETVPYHVVGRADLDRTAPHPTMIYGYGGFNHACVPEFIGHYGMAAFVEAGGVFVHANLRGGAECGDAFRQSGRLRHKQNTFNDLYAVAEALVAAGVTTRDKLGVVGASNGGLLAAAAAVQRPDLFAVCIPRVGILDVVRARIYPYGLWGVKQDYGDPGDPGDLHYLLSYSPYQNIEDGTDYPAVFVEAGSNDPACPAWLSRKFAARLQRATASDNPVLLRVWHDVGHGATGKHASIEQDTHCLAFAMQQLGLTPAEKA